jgi:hypothetical protein
LLLYQPVAAIKNTVKIALTTPGSPDNQLAGMAS